MLIKYFQLRIITHFVPTFCPQTFKPTEVTLCAANQPKVSNLNQNHLSITFTPFWLKNRWPFSQPVDTEAVCISLSHFCDADTWCVPQSIQPVLLNYTHPERLEVPARSQVSTGATRYEKWAEMTFLMLHSAGFVLWSRNLCHYVNTGFYRGGSST